MNRLQAAVLALCCAAVPALAAAPDEDQLADAVEYGGLAALAPMCGLRDEAWSADLRRSQIQAGTGTLRHDDAGLAAAPGSNLIVGALSYAETEALEDFAENPAAVTCEPLRRSPVLRRADDLVRRFRTAAAPGS